ncbi:hypothetical protein [Actinosynnema sp. NPDC020468]|uniref:phthiocerol/phthiodiolone dimycocerosyl transferase family protein n=1 Tax=Actinosynnema sp. NPDC020468 TaxID=3154488 RepID=UPI0033F8C883
MSVEEIRRLTPGEEIFAGAHAYIGHAVLVAGRVDEDALAAAFDAVVRSYPVVGAALKPHPDGGHVLVTSETPPAISVVAGDPDDLLAGSVLDQGVRLGAVGLVRDGARASVTLSLHHSVADGAHGVALLAALWSRYADAVEGRPVVVEPHGYPLPAEQVLTARGVVKIPLDRLPRVVDCVPPAPPVEVAAGEDESEVDERGFLALRATRVLLTVEQTAGLVALARAEGVTVNSLVSAAILLAEAECRGCSLAHLLHVYAVNLRPMVSPPVGAAEATNLVGSAVYPPTTTSPTELVGLARAIRSELESQVAAGLPLQTPLHLGDAPEEGEPTTRLVVAATNFGRIPELPSTAGSVFEEYRVAMAGKPIPGGSRHAVSGTCVIHSFGGRLGVEVHHSAAMAGWERRRTGRVRAALVSAVR